MNPYSIIFLLLVRSEMCMSVCVWCLGVDALAVFHVYVSNNASIFLAHVLHRVPLLLLTLTLTNFLLQFYNLVLLFNSFVRCSKVGRRWHEQHGQRNFAHRLCNLSQLLPCWFLLLIFVRSFGCLTRHACISFFNLFIQKIVCALF